MDNEWLDRQVRQVFREMGNARRKLEDMRDGERARNKGNSGEAGQVLEHLNGAYAYLALIDQHLKSNPDSN